MDIERALHIARLRMHPDNDADARTVWEYLLLLARRVIKEDEGFSGKRPFGNSGWLRELAWALVTGGVIEGTAQGDGQVDDWSEGELKSVLLQVVDAVRGDVQ